ncbi:MAG: hypothetical protein JHC95_04485 [Solirubrobacteraceae bacterium]|nr:hypothetical protein [Solirubrobacteraceae bacterium]
MAERVVIITPEPLSQPVARGLAEEFDGADVTVVAPALNDSPLAFWVSDADEAIAEAETVARETADTLRDEGANVGGSVGDSDPLQAIEDAVRRYEPSRVIAFVRDDGQAYREDQLEARSPRAVHGVRLERRVIPAG